MRSAERTSRIEEMHWEHSGKLYAGMIFKNNLESQNHSRNLWNAIDLLLKFRDSRSEKASIFTTYKETREQDSKWEK